jgi:hypothetical protein
VANFFAFAPNQRGNVRVATKDIDGDNQLDVIVSSDKTTAASVRTYLGTNLTPQGEPMLNQAFDPF